MPRPLIRVGNFVKRQTWDSKFSYFQGSWEELEKLTKECYDAGGARVKPGYRPGVILVEVPPDKFRSAIVQVAPLMNIQAEFQARTPEEEKVLSIYAIGEKVQATHVDIILYHHDVLAEDEGATFFTLEEADYEIVSINAQPDDKVVPMNPIAMARNFLHKKGGTKAEYTAEQFAEAIWYWGQHCNVKKVRE